MTLQEKKNYLAQYRSLNRRIERRENEIEQWHSRAEKMATNFDCTTSIGNGNGDTIQSAIDRILELEQRLSQDTLRLVAMRENIENAIAGVQDETGKELLELRYIYCCKYEEIALKMNYGFRHIKRLHNKAIMSLNVPQI